MVWNQCNPKWGYNRFCNYLVNYYRRRRFPTGDRHQGCWSRRRHRHHRNNYPNLYHYFIVYLLAIAPAYAEEPRVQNTSNPVAAATGNVTNQAVQFQNNGAPSRQYFGANNSCNGATMTFSPFYMGNDTIPMDPTGYVTSNNWGAQLNFSVPLDGSMVETCKHIAKRHEQKMRLEYELFRAKSCTDILKAGFMFRPGSRVEGLCHDIVPIVSINNAGSTNKRSDSRNSRGSSAQ